MSEKKQNTNKTTIYQKTKAKQKQKQTKNKHLFNWNRKPLKEAFDLHDFADFIALKDVIDLNGFILVELRRH